MISRDNVQCLEEKLEYAFSVYNFLVFEVEVELNFFTIREINQAPAADGTRNKIITILKNGTVRSDWVQLWGRKYLNINKNWSIFLPVAARAMEIEGVKNYSQ